MCVHKLSFHHIIHASRWSSWFLSRNQNEQSYTCPLIKYENVSEIILILFVLYAKFLPFCNFFNCWCCWRRFHWISFILTSVCTSKAYCIYGKHTHTHLSILMSWLKCVQVWIHWHISSCEHSFLNSNDPESLFCNRHTNAT